MKLAAGTTVKTYTLDELLGLGAAGEVWKAHDDMKTVAIKFMNPKLLLGDDSEKHMTRLKREVESLTHLQHPNVPTLYDYDLECERPYLVMRYIGGDTYDKLIARGQMLQLSLSQRLHMISELAQALSAAHSLGIIHRDVKPANMIGIENPYLLDFGIALKAENLNETMRNVGTALYMAPDDPADEISDNFSFALVTYEILFGAHAIFMRDNQPQSQFQVYTRFLAGERIKNHEWRMPSKLAAKDLPADLQKADLRRLDTIFEKALGEREERYADLHQFVDDVKNAIPGAAPAASPTASAEATDLTAQGSSDGFTQIQASVKPVEPAPTPNPPRRSFDPRLLAGAAAIIVIVVLIFLLLGRQ
jgi:serine/threonine protein kinase